MASHLGADHPRVSPDTLCLLLFLRRLPTERQGVMTLEIHREASSPCYFSSFPFMFLYVCQVIFFLMPPKTMELPCTAAGGSVENICHYRRAVEHCGFCCIPFGYSVNKVWPVWCYQSIPNYGLFMPCNLIPGKPILRKQPSCPQSFRMSTYRLSLFTSYSDVFAILSLGNMLMACVRKNKCGRNQRNRERFYEEKNLAANIWLFFFFRQRASS